MILILNMFSDNRKILIKAYSKKELSELYGVSSSTFVRWINKKSIYIELSKSGYCKYQKVLQPSLINIIFKHLGLPEKEICDELLL